MELLYFKNKRKYLAKQNRWSLPGRDLGNVLDAVLFIMVQSTWLMVHKIGEIDQLYANFYFHTEFLHFILPDAIMFAFLITKACLEACTLYNVKLFISSVI